MRCHFKILMALFVMACTSAQVKGQTMENNYGHPCAFDQKRNELLDHDPELRKMYHQLNEDIARYTMNHAHDLRSATTYTLPVVVHIISPPGTAIGQGNNLTDEEVFKGLALLNDAFANKGLFNITDGVDIEIQFCMAQRDPQNNPTNGITRHESTLVSEPSCNPSSPFATNKDSDVFLKKIVNWDCRSYINVWLVTDLYGFDFGCSLAGYAYFPGAPCTLDGIVQESRYWNSLKGTEITAHEFGHYFNLNHTFFGGCYNTGDCLIDGDQVCDTPPDSGPGGLCNDNSCTFDTPDLLDDRYNYMEYYTCKPLHFTNGQRDRMVAALIMRRNGLITSLGCKPVAQNDIAIFTAKPKDCPGLFCPVIGMHNTGINSVLNATIMYSLDGTSMKLYNWTGNLMSNDTVLINLPYEAVSEGLYSIEATAINPNGVTDTYPINNTSKSQSYFVRNFLVDFVSYPISPLNYIFVPKGYGISSYKWGFGDGLFSTMAQPTHAYAKAGQYTVTLEVTSSCGDKKVYSKLITISEVCDIGWSPYFTLFGEIINADYSICEYLIQGFLTNQYIFLPGQEEVIADFHFNFCDTICTGPAFTFKIKLRTSNSFVSNSTAQKTTIELRGGGRSMGVVLKDAKNKIDTTKIWAGSYSLNEISELDVDLSIEKEIELRLLKDTFYFSYDNGKQKYKIPFDGRICDLEQMALTFSDKVFIDEITILDALGKVTYFENFNDCIFADPVRCTQLPLMASLSETIKCDSTIHLVTVNGSKWPLTYTVEPLNLNIPDSVYRYINLPNGKYTINVNAVCPDDALAINFEVKKQVLADTLVFLEGLRCNRKGTIIVDGLGGNAPYEFQINGGSWQFNNVFSNLDTGLYTIKIRDANGCVRQRVEKINDLNKVLQLQIDSINLIPCSALNTGYAIMTATGSSPYYYYRLNGGPYQGYGIFDRLKPGTYSAEAIDDGGCTSQPVSFTIKKEENFINTSSSYNICKGATLLIGNKQYDTGGIFLDTIVAATGCDTIITITINELLSSSFNQQVSICQNQQLKIGNNIYSKTGTYTDTLVNSQGCDSIVKTILTVIKPDFKNQSISICQNESLKVGTNTYTQAGLYTDTLIAKNGCDSIVTTTLDIINSKAISQNISLCQNQSIKVGNNTYAVSGKYIDTLTALSGCDSIITTEIFILNASSYSQIINQCEGDTVKIGNHNYFTSGNYIDTLPNVNGCDSVIYSTLRLNKKTTTSQNSHLCEGQSLQIGQQTITSSGIFADTLQTINGCDSILNFYVTMYNRSTTNLRKSICNGSSFIFGNITYNKAGIYTDTLMNINLCDSVVTLDLKIIDTFNINKYFTICQGEELTIDGMNYNSAGIYKKTYKSKAGCDSTVFINLVDADLSILCDSFKCVTYVPNIISLGETNNDFTVLSKNMTFASLEIYDRWGNKMFYTNDPLQSWQGLGPNGNLAVPGVYVYLIKGVCADGKPYFKYGDVTLVR